jgi:hypothetical protein
MPMFTDASDLPPDEARGLWLALTASQLGAAHQAVGLHNLVPAITGRWRNAVRDDIAADPFTI